MLSVFYQNEYGFRWMSYFRNLFIAIDQLGNALTGGNPDVTISARTGYFANVEHTSLRWWWKCMESVINFTFLPIDGPDHCMLAYRNDKEGRSVEGNDFMRALLGVLVIMNCVALAVLIRLWVFIVPAAKFKPAS
jgi:hypothetical protein